MKTIEQLLLDYGDACFNCGNYAGESALDYKKYNQTRAKTFSAVLDKFRKLKSERDLLNKDAKQRQRRIYSIHPI
jgi:hypothetical protein